jgi:hypothetical protein
MNNIYNEGINYKSKFKNRTCILKQNRLIKKYPINSLMINFENKLDAQSFYDFDHRKSARTSK